MRAVVLLLLATLPAASRGAEAVPEDDAYDREFLKQHQVEPDVPGLLAFFRARTLTDEKVKRIGELIAQLGHPRYPLRDRAARELLSFDVAALRFLETANRNSDPEIADRARRLSAEIANGPGASLPLTAVRQLRSQTSGEALQVLLDYLPFADDRVVEDAVLDALRKIGQRDGRAHPLFITALTDRFAARRAAAGCILGRSPAAEDRALARKLLQDADPWVRLRTAEGLVDGCDKAAIPALIDLIGQVASENEEATWRGEELLRRIGGAASPAPLTDDKPESRRNYVKAWSAWYEKSVKGIDLAKLPREPPMLGLFLGIEYNTNSVWECGRDGKRCWTIQAEGPMDAQVLPGNRVLIAEQTANRVTERDRKGNILWQYKSDGIPYNCRRMPNGNTFVGTGSHVLEIRPDMSVAFKYKFGDGNLHGVRRMPNGHFVAISGAGNIFEMNPAGKLIRTVKLAGANWGDVVSLPGARYLVSNHGAGFVREVDANGKTIHEVKILDACGLDLLPNGRLLVSGGQLGATAQGFAKIIDWTGKCAWEIASNGCVRRMHRR